MYLKSWEPINWKSEEYLDPRAVGGTKATGIVWKLNWVFNFIFNGNDKVGVVNIWKMKTKRCGFRKYFSEMPVLWVLCRVLQERFWLLKLINRGWA